MEELIELRAQGVRVIAAVAWLITAIIAGGSFFAATGFLPAVLALALSVYPTVAAAKGHSDTATRIALGATMPVFCAILLYQWSGHGWLIDLHMTFFAMIAILAGLADWRPVLAGAAVTAVHHLVLNFAAPAYVFGADADFARVVLHAVIVVIETAVLMVLAQRLEAMLLAQVAARAEVVLAEQAAERERAQRDAEQRLVVDHIERGLKALAAGELDCRIDQRFPPAFEALRADFNSALGDLNALVGSVAQCSGEIQNGTREIRMAADDLSRRTEMQASTVEQASHAIGQVAVSANQTAALATETSDTLNHSQARAAQGREVMARAMATMGQIEHSATEIAQIVSLIDGIAFQTNLLALNAGVEAARAGDAGKGFAVVANEVRALAQRSADAAKDIKALITASSSQVSEGVSLVTRTGDVLQELLDEVTGITGTVVRIAEAARGNAADLTGVRETFGNIDRSTQQNAAMVEESNAALRALAQETDTLMAAVNRFHGTEARAPLRRAA
ncbi:MAG: methyl-accepting chemotaxis protein [Sphingomonadales bacterium]|nr:methyl-accepting chemotaxis protein [Sphingomonadales bacterium]